MFRFFNLGGCLILLWWLFKITSLQNVFTERYHFREAIFSFIPDKCIAINNTTVKHTCMKVPPLICDNLSENHFYILIRLQTNCRRSQTGCIRCNLKRHHSRNSPSRTYFLVTVFSLIQTCANRNRNAVTLRNLHCGLDATRTYDRSDYTH